MRTPYSGECPVIYSGETSITDFPKVGTQYNELNTRTKGREHKFSFSIDHVILQNFTVHADPCVKISDLLGGHRIVVESFGH